MLLLLLPDVVVVVDKQELGRVGEEREQRKFK